MTDSTIIEELHRVRDELAARYDYDVRAVVAALREKQQSENRPVVSLSPKRATAEADSISEVKERVSDLICQEKVGGLSPEEAAELDGYPELEHPGRLAKARLHQRQSSGGHENLGG